MTCCSNAVIDLRERGGAGEIERGIEVCVCVCVGADLVKPVSFHPNDPKNQGTDIFSRLIPMRAHEVASIYSEEKAKLMRSVMSSVEEKDEELEYVKD